MSDCSSSSNDCRYERRCYCGLVARRLISWTVANPGRKFYRCPKPDDVSCEFWVWHDEEIPSRALMLISDLKLSLKAVKIERDKLKEKAEALDAANAAASRKIMKLEDKVHFWRNIVLISWLLFVGLLAAKMVN